MDAGLICAAQKVEHYEIAAYGTLVAWARAMRHADAVTLLEETLEEEKATDKRLTALAERSVNPQAAKTAHTEQAEEGSAPTRAGHEKAAAPRARAAGRSR
jgi:ferritin-like metal-binding protein YciE